MSVCAWAADAQRASRSSWLKLGNDSADRPIDAAVPGEGSATILLRFDAPQTIQFWCAPHSKGAADEGSGMVGTLVVQ